MKNYPEATEQIAFVEWLELKGYKFTAFPNETHTESWNQKRKNREMGVRKGVPDLIVVIPCFGLIFIEMKAPSSKPKKGLWDEVWKIGQKTRGGVTIEQKEWIDALNTIENVQAEVCYSCSEAIDLIERLEALAKLAGVWEKNRLHGKL